MDHLVVALVDLYRIGERAFDQRYFAPFHYRGDIVLQNTRSFPLVTKFVTIFLSYPLFRAKNEIEKRVKHTLLLMIFFRCTLFQVLNKHEFIVGDFGVKFLLGHKLVVDLGSFISLEDGASCHRNCILEET